MLTGFLMDNAQAVEDTEVCIVDGERLKALMMKYPTIAVKVLEEMGARLGRAENLIENLGLYSVEARIARTLLDLADDEGKVVLNLQAGLGIPYRNGSGDIKPEAVLFSGYGMDKVGRPKKDNNTG